MREFTNKSEFEKTQFNVNIAGLEAEINTVYPSSFFFCQQYISDGVPLFKIWVTQEDIQNEIDEGKEFFYTYTGHEDDNKGYEISKKINESQLELSIVYRKFVEAALDYDIVFMHGAVIAYNNQSIMFTAPSGTGKTTHVMQWLQNLKDTYIVNGDKPLIKITDNDVTAYGTPWCGKEKMNTNTKMPLKAIVLMERNEQNHIEEISFGQAYPFLLRQTYLPHDPEKAKKTLILLSKLYKQVHIYRFLFNNFEDNCFKVAYQGIFGTKE